MTDKRKDIDEETGTGTASDVLIHQTNGNNNINKNDININKDDTDVIKRGTVTAVPPDGGWGWMVVLASFGISFLVDGVCFSFGIFFDEFRDYFGTSKAVTSWIGSVLNGSYLTLGPIVSALVNMYGCRAVCVSGALLSFIAFFLSTFSPNIGVLIFTYGFLGGLGFGLMYLPAIVMVGYYFERRRALATGLACCGSGIGAFLFAPFTEYLLKEYGWRGSNWILSALVLHGLAFAIFYRPLTPDATSVNPQQVEDDPRTGKSAELMDMTDVTVSSNGDNKVQRSPTISADLKVQIFESLKSDQDLSPIYRTRSMTVHTPEISTAGQTSSNGASETARLAFSQDFSLLHRKRPVEQKNVPNPNPSMPPLQRKDIFYSGSLWHLKEYNEVGSSEEYRKTVADTTESQKRASSLDRKGFIQSFISVFDISLLKSPTFLIYGISCFLCMAGFFVPFVYMPTHAIDMGLDTTSAAFLISIIGITNTVGRVAVGFVSDQPWADCLLINNIALITGGVATLFVPFYLHYYLLALYAAVFGTCIAVFVSLRSIIMVELMGLEKLTTAFGFVIMCQGVSSLLGPPLAGTISDMTGNYNAAFYLAGIAMTLSGVICLPIRKVANWETQKKLKASNAENSMKVAAIRTEYSLQDENTTDESQAMI